ncbi:MAG: hypothetical protein N2578_00765 [Bdellovibrionaceae bacterium]|nr:hypothetical protein [Pseudobdellovibrionaceae bacterium]
MNFVEFKRNQSGILIPYENGVALCDSKDPIAEAAYWLDRQPRIRGSCFVLGIGRGDHIRGLIKRDNPTWVHAVELRDHLAPIVFADEPEIESRIQIHRVSSAEEVLRSGLVEMAADKGMPVLGFEPGFGAQEEEFYKIWQHLTGRSKSALERISKHWNLDLSVEELNDDGRWLSIKDLAMVVDTQSRGNPLVTVVSVLRELVL